MLLVALAGSASGWWTRPAVAQLCGGTRVAGCGFDPCKTPAQPVPQSLWGTLKPADTAPYSDGRDLTSFNEFVSRYDSNPFFFSIDIQQGYAFTAMDYGVKVWDVRSGGSPAFLGYMDWHSFLFWPQGQELKTPLQDISLPAGNISIGAVAGQAGIGTAIVDFSSLSRPRVVYQDSRGDATAVYAVNLGGTNYAFAAASAGTPSLHVYNMDAAARLSVPCNEVNGGCGGVHVGTIGTRAPQYVAGVDHFVAVSSGSSTGVDVWDVTNPAAPTLKLTTLNNFAVYGIAMWDGGGRTYLAARTGPIFSNPSAPLALQILDVSCLAGICGSAPVVGTYLDTSGAAGAQSYFLTMSTSNGTPFLYLGSDQYCGGIALPQREWLLDVSNPSAPTDITPPSTQAGGYWGWYYQDNNPTGFNLIMPRKGKFWGSYFYRVAQTLFDVHQRAGAVAPTAAFTWNPLTVYLGQAINFTDQSFGQPSQWSWSFAPDGNPATSAQQNPANVTFPTIGPKSVSLTAKNTSGQNQVTQTVNVLDPHPQVASVSVSPQAPLQCQPVTLTANNVLGQPPLSWTWAITNGGNPAPGGSSAAANSFTWDTKANAAQPGSYVGKVTVNNATNSPASAQASFTLGSLPSLPLSFAPTNDSFTNATVQFHVSAAGATEWNWNFGDGSGFTGWSTDPVNGPNPSHTYAATGTYNVQVMVRNCVNLTGVTSSSIQVQITQVSPLVASFTPQCLFGFCAFVVNSPVFFTDNSQGALFWEYDWNGTGTFSDTCNTAPVTSHTYTVAGTYSPALRIRRGSSNCNSANETKSYTAPPITVSANTSPPSISVFGPSSGTPNTSYTFSATSANCTPSATWSWTANGATISGSSTDASITLSWASAGTYSVTAFNSGCGVSGNAGIFISTGTTGGGTLKSSFTYSPQAPAAGQAVNFDGSSSTGSPTAYNWDFGDGVTIQGATSAGASHVFSQAGTYQVKLDVVAPGSGTNCFGGNCVAESIQAITVTGQSGPPPPPLNPEFTSPACVNNFGIVTCAASTGQAVAMTAQETNAAASFAWDFGDGTTGTGSAVTHTWPQPQSYTVSLTVSATGSTTAQKTHVFQITGAPPPPPPSSQSVVLPWVALTRGALVQSCDLYLHNPSLSPLPVTLTFYKRGLAQNPPPQATATIQPGATMFAPNVVSSVFQRDNISGFMTVTVKSTDPLPIMTSFNTVVRGDGGQFGQTVPGITPGAAASASRASSASQTSTFQDLVGLNDNSSQLAYFGVSNPSSTTATYHVRLFDSAGNKIGESNGDLQVAPFGQRQFQQEDVHNLFGFTGASDYRVEIENKSAAVIIPYGENVRLGSGDPSFLTPGSSSAATQYVIGAFSNTGTWQSDVVLANTSSQPMTIALTFTHVGVFSSPTPPVALTLNPGQTERLSNAIAGEWNLNNVVGIITISSTGAAGIYPVVQAETYNIANPANRFGQSMRALADTDAAATGQTDYLVGLRQDADHLTTYWVFNPSPTSASVDLVYRNLDGTVLGTLSNVGVPAGRARQFLPSAHPLPAAGATNGFTVQVVVKSGKAIAAAQVLTLSTGDPAYILGMAH